MAFVDPKRKQTIVKTCCIEQCNSTQKHCLSMQELNLFRWLEGHPYCFFLGVLLHTFVGSMEVCILPIHVPLCCCISLLAANGVSQVGVHLQLTFADRAPGLGQGSDCV